MAHSLSHPALAASAALAGLASLASAQTTIRVNVGSAGAQSDGITDPRCSISSDGRFVSFPSLATDLVPGDTNSSMDVFVHDALTGATERASVATGGAQANDNSFHSSISADGRYVVFCSEATNLVAGATPLQIYVHDRQTSSTEMVSVATGGAPANSSNFNFPPSISADGRYVAFWSAASNLVGGDTNGLDDIFVRDRLAGTTERVTVDSAGAQANGQCGYPSISADGRFVAFTSAATNLVPGDTNGAWDMFVHDRQTGLTERVSVDSAGVQADGDSDYRASFSADGRFLAFSSYATNLVAGDTNGFGDVFVRDRQTGTTGRVSVDSSGAQGIQGGGNPSISADGRYVAFDSTSNDLVPGDTNGTSDVFVHDLVTGATERASLDAGGAQGNRGSEYPWVSADGRYVAFASDATNLVSGDTNGLEDIFVRDRGCTGSIASYCTAKVNSLGCLPSIGSSGLPSQSGPDDFYVTASGVRNRKLGMMLWSRAPDASPFFGGTLCVHDPIHRTPGQDSGGSASGNDCTGSYAFHFSQGYMLQQLLGANTTVYAQFWSRDPGFAPPNNVGLTNGLQFTICP